MNIEDLRDYCLSKKAATESMPFDESILVFKVGSKLFGLMDIDKSNFINLKSDPEKAIQLREEFSDIVPGYHMNKTHWNTVYLNGSLTDKLIKELIDDSYQLVYNKLTRKEKAEIDLLV